MYLLTHRGTLMPITTEGVTTEAGLVEVTAPQGKVYTVDPANVVSQEDGDYLLRLHRAQQLAAEGYDAKRRADGSYRVYSEDKHGQHGGYLVTETSCTCPDAAKGHTCKHQLGLCGLLHIIAANKAAQRAAVITVQPLATATETAAPLAPATRVKPSARLAEMIQRDGWE